MKNKGGILLLFAALLLLSLYYLARTWKINDIRKDAAAYATVDGRTDAGKKQYYLDSLWKQPVFLGSTVESLTKQELGLGLDLQGGMHVILEVSPADIIKSLAKGSRDSRVNQAVEKTRALAAKGSINFVDEFVKEYKKTAPDAKLASIFSNSSNRDVLSLSSSDTQVINYIQGEIDGAFDRSYKVIQTRVDKFGVSNANMSKIPGTNRIQVELPGIDNPVRVRKLLSGSAKLEFCEVYSLQEIAPNFDSFTALLQRIDAETRAQTPSTATTATADTTTSSLASALQSKTESTAADSLSSLNSLANMFIASPTGGLAIKTKDTTRLNNVLRRPDAQGIFPADLTFLYDVSPIEGTTGGDDIVNVYPVKSFGNAPLGGDVITNARQDFDPMTGRPDVSMQMNAFGARKWKELTGKNVGRSIAIILDNYVYSAPNVNAEISGGNSSISGNFTVEQAQDLANVLKAGKLPAPTSIVEEAVVGASVGSQAFQAGVISALVGLLAVLIFVVAYYSSAGWIANLALIINLVLLLGIMASFGATMTLPGIAGMVLSIGMSVDANVLIYERIKEEMASGKSFAAAIPLGFKNAMPSIMDSQLTSVITGVILFIFGTGLIKGFATTLLIGIGTSLFCAIFVSRLIFDNLIKKGKTINFRTAWTEKLFGNSNIDFIKNRNRFYMISGALILAGLVSIGIRGFSLGVDFKGGRTFEAKFEKTVNTDDVRNAVESVFPESAVEVKTYGGFDKVKITSAYRIDDAGLEVDDELKTNLNKAIADVKGNKGTVVSTSKVGANIAQDTIWSSVKAVIYAIVLTFIYILIRFRKAAFGWGAVLALVHDVLVILGIFSILNGLLPFSMDIDQAFIGAVLTLMGYSLNDTIVIYDRIREYMRDKAGKSETIETVINNALNSTLSRTAVTGIATLIVLFVLLIFGGETIRGFIFCMFIGVIVGTYSSLFISAPFVVDALNRKEKKDAAKAALAASTKPTV
jgi:SecD/SecF fusion protein